MILKEEKIIGWRYMSMNRRRDDPPCIKRMELVLSTGATWPLPPFCTEAFADAVVSALENLKMGAPYTGVSRRLP